jgi:hypothetical protein
MTTARSETARSQRSRRRVCAWTIGTIIA